MMQARILDPYEIDRLREAGGPLAEVPDLARLADATVVVVEVDGRIVAYWPIFKAVHVEPLWVTEDHRRHVGVLKALFTLVAEELHKIGEPVAFAIVGDDGVLEQGAQYIDRLGFTPVPGTLHYVVLQQED